MARYGGHRIPDEYHSNWAKTMSLGEWWEWWHLGYEDGISQAEWDYGIPHNEEDRKDTLKIVEQLRLENEQLKNLLSANVRVIKKELRKELEANPKFNS